MKKILIVLILTTTAIAQERLLVSPDDEVIPLHQGESAFEVFRQRLLKPSSTVVCSDQLIFPPPCPPWSICLPPNNNIFGAFHKDVMAMRFTAPATGTIDTLYWLMFNIGALDSVVVIRLFESNIYKGQGPGYPPYHPPCVPWGYYLNSSDLDQWIAPFRDEATDTNWISTYTPSTVQSFDPFGEELWGGGGFPVRALPNSVKVLPMDVLGYKPTVQRSEEFFITMKVNSPPYHPDPKDSRTEWSAHGLKVTPNDYYYPSRVWKFYEHDRGPSNCNGFPLDSLRRGWYARGGSTLDSLDVFVWDWWYSMTLIGNTPPNFLSVDKLNNTLSTDEREIRAEIEDCNVANPESAGVASAILYYTINGVTKDSGGISMTNIGGNLWSGFIPATSAGSIITYYIQAQDLNGESTTSGVFSYQVVTLRNEYFYADTVKTCVPKNISGSGTLIPPSQFFLPSSAGSRAEAGDDGTAGPFEIGGPMEFNGNTVRYAWIGVNGAITLTASATDTQHLNSDGYFNEFWTIPGGEQHNIPKNFIAAYWADHTLVQDSPFVHCGRILYGNGGDTCQFIVEWDSIGAHSPYGIICEETTFRIILNRCDGTIEFQYDNVGTIGLDSSALVGIEADSSGPRPGGWIFINKNGYPLETRLRNNWCIKFYPVIATAAPDGWNLVSVPVIPPNGNYSCSFLFPSAESRCFGYDSEAGYILADTLSIGRGYWIKFSGGQFGGIPGTPVYDLCISLQNKWNLIGSISKPIPVDSVTFTDATMSSADFFGYSGGYFAATTIQPAQAYWVKV
ncbi:MAG: hypothetical protein HY707_12015, partial [Ignavibacteriae bacterium]|nr:hypothetical protein [Ignavibacteriota bacterium]